MDQLRKFIVLTLPVIVMIAWAGCLSVCAEDTSEQEQSLVSIHQQDEDCGSSIESLCAKECTLATPVASADRQNITVAEAEYVAVPTRTYFLIEAGLQPRAPVVKRNFIPPSAVPLSARPGNLRV